MPASAPRANLPLVSPMDRALFLRAQPYFAGVDASILASIATYSEERFLRPGEWLQKEGTDAARLALLSEGEVSLMREGEVVHRVSSPGGVGIISALAESNWSPGIVAIRPTVYLDLGLRDFLQILEDRFGFVLQIARVLAKESPARALRGDRSGAVIAESGLIEHIVIARRNALFADMNLIALVELLRTATESPLEPGRPVLSPNATDEGVTLLLDGSLSSRSVECGVRLGPGDVIGLDALLGSGSETPWVADSAARVLRIPRARYLDTLEDHFSASRSLLRHLARRALDTWTRS